MSSLKKFMFSFLLWYLSAADVLVFSFLFCLFHTKILRFVTGISVVLSFPSWVRFSTSTYCHLHLSQWHYFHPFFFAVTLFLNWKAIFCCTCHSVASLYCTFKICVLLLIKSMKRDALNNSLTPSLLFLSLLGSRAQQNQADRWKRKPYKK